MPVQCLRTGKETRVIVEMKGLQKNKFQKIGGEKPEFCRAHIRDDINPQSIQR